MIRRWKGLPGRFTAKCVLSMWFCLSAHAQWADPSGRHIPDSDERKSNGTFIAQMIFIGDEQAFFQTWRTPGKTVNLTTIDQVSINEPISSFIIFAGCEPDASGSCNVTMRFKVTQPDGKVYAETPDMEVWRNQAPPSKTLEASVDYLKIVVEPHEQLGAYVVAAEITDQVSGKVIALKKTIHVADDPKRR